MKTKIMYLLMGLAGSALSYAAMRYDVIPEPEAPLSTNIHLFGPEQGFVGQDYFFHAEIRGDHGRPEWSVPANVDISTTPDGIAARIRCEHPGSYPISVAVGGKDGSVSTSAAYFDAVDLDSEIDFAVSQATAVATSEPPPPTLAEIVSNLPNFPSDAEMRTEAAGKFAYMAKRLQDGVVPSSSDPVAMLRNELGEPFLGFLGDVEGIINELRVSGAVTTPASMAPVLEEVAIALGRGDRR